MGSKTIVVVGAGPGGLAAAMVLASRGFEVKVFEKQARIGGRNAEMEVGPYRFDLGPTFLMMKYLLDEVFESAGRKCADYLDCRLLDPMYRLNFAHRSMLVYSDPVQMRAEIERVFPGEGAGLERFLTVEEKRFRKLYPCLQKPYDGALSLLSPTLMAAAPYIAAGRSLYDVLSDYFRSEELRLAFTFQSKYLGMSPWDCPGLFAMIPYTEHAHGIYHVMGGLNRITQAFAQVAREHGAEIHTSCGVKQVLLRHKQACGVELENGERIMADEVVINADFGQAMRTLFPGEALGKYEVGKLEKLKYSCSTFMMYLGLDKLYPEVEHHTIIFSQDYKKCLEDITRNKCISEGLSVYVRNSSPIDPACAPAGHSALYVLAPVPNNTSGIDWHVHKSSYREMMLDILEKRSGLRDLRNHIQQELIVTPEDWEEKMSVFLGATFNLGHSWDQLLLFRPHNKFELFDNTYLVGGGTHPGSGLPTIFQSAIISSNLICDKYRVAYADPQPFHEARIA
ncbi:phytoene desaturase family protein [Silvibacterium sp.]|uniref:phytoene desaturase family protein n=1 Tax=Silvibacterium sp. TaxID=1964179 RepID=UPI0039E25411